jgi:hypothetical protein
MSTRRQALAAALAASMLPVAALAQPRPRHATLPAPASLADALARALAARKSLVVMVSLDGCPYCHVVRDSYLAPMHAEGQPVVQIEMARSTPLVDLQGAPSTHERVARALRIRVAPTVLFLGRGGQEAAPRIAGMPIPDFYGAYLQERVDAANRSVGAT